MNAPIYMRTKKNAKNENAKERKKKTQKINEDAYFQERKRIFSRKKTQKKIQSEGVNSRRTMST